MHLNSPAAILLCCLSSVLPTVNALALEKRSAIDPYAPYSVSCPRPPSVRKASEQSPKEKAYVRGRQWVASQALAKWVKKNLDCSFDALPWNLPTLAIALSGGGPKAGLITAGAVQALDGRDDPGPVAGLLQAMTYISALSGGSLTLTGVMTNDFAKISTLKDTLYNQNYLNPFSLPVQQTATIQANVNNKTLAGYPASLLDVYGRAISYDFIGGIGGGDGTLWSNVTTQSSFSDYSAPFPIITLTDTDVPDQLCFPNVSSPIWEVSPFEFGSWDPDVDGFFPTKYLGTPVHNGSVHARQQCTVGFDNAGFFMGTSANILTSGKDGCSTGSAIASSLNDLGRLIYLAIPANVLLNPYAIVPNPFYKSRVSGSVSDRQDLYMLDGGDTGQGIPIYPWLQPEREIDVIFVVDAASTGPSNITNGGSVLNTYKAAQAQGIKRMPPVPDLATFAAQNLSQHASFYGCHDRDVGTVVFFPNTYTTQFDGSTFFWNQTGIDQVFYAAKDGITQANNTEWPTCLACGIMHKKLHQLPDVCTSCLDKYCWSP